MTQSSGTLKPWIGFALLYNSRFFFCSYVPMFGETEFDPNRTFPSVSFEEQLTALDKAICAGKVSGSAG